MRVAKLVILVLLAALAAVLCAACEPAEEKEPSAEEWIDKGKKLLGEGDGTGAYVAFQNALDQDRGSLQARYGVVLADVLQFTATIDLVSTMLTEAPADVSSEDTTRMCQQLDECGVLDSVSATFDECIASVTFGLDEDTIACVIDAPDCDTMFERCGVTLPASTELCSDACVRLEECDLLGGGGWTQTECAIHCPQLYLAGELECLLAADDCTTGVDSCFADVGTSVQEFLADFWEDIDVEMNDALAKVQSEPDNFSFEIDKYNVSLLGLPWQPSLSGRHDYTDTFLFRSIYSGMDALFSTSLGVNLDFNPLALAMFMTMPDLTIDLDDLSAGDLEQIVALLEWVDDLIDVILNDPVHTSFLTLLEPDGEATLQQVGQQIGTMFGALADMIEQVEAEGDDPDDPIHFLDQNSDGEWNVPEPLIIPGVAQLEYDLAWAVHDVLLALKIDFVDGYPFQYESLEPLLAYFDLAWINSIIEVLDLLGIDGIDLGQTFREPQPEGLRPLLADLQVLIEQLIELLSPTS